MAVGMLKVKLAHAPWFIGWRPGNYQSLLQRERMRGINFGWRRHPPTHPNATGVIVSHVLRRCAAARALSALAEKYLDFSVAHATKVRRIAPVPGFRPAKLFKPGKTLRDVGDVEN